MTFFSEGSDPRVELSQMMGLSKRLLRLDLEAGQSLAHPFLELSPATVLPMVERGELPACVVPLMAGSCATFASPKNYALAAYWELHLTTKPSSPLRAVADRVAPLGVGGQSYYEWILARPQLYAMRHVGEPWLALMLACDALLGGSEPARVSLGSLAARAPTRAWLQFLAEMTERVAGVSDVRLATPSEPLLLTGDVLSEVRCMMRPGDMEKASAAWAELARPKPPWTPAAGVDGAPTPEEIGEEEQLRAEQGPFFDLRPSAEVERTMIPPLWSMMLGFRQLYGLSLMYEALPQAEAWLAQAMASA